MARTPRPDGWQGGSEDFTFVRTFDGHLGATLESDPDFATDIDARRNAQTFEQADLGTHGDLDGA